MKHPLLPLLAPPPSCCDLRFRLEYLRFFFVAFPYRDSSPSLPPSLPPFRPVYLLLSYWKFQVAKIFVKKYLPKQNIDAAEEMLQSIRLQFKKVGGRHALGQEEKGKGKTRKDLGEGAE